MPGTATGPSTYFVPAESQETVWFVELSHGESASLYPGTVLFQLSFTVFAVAPGVQTSSLNCFMVAALTADGSP